MPAEQNIDSGLNTPKFESLFGILKQLNSSNQKGHGRRNTDIDSWLDESGIKENDLDDATDEIRILDEVIPKLIAKISTSFQTDTNSLPDDVLQLQQAYEDARNNRDNYLRAVLPLQRNRLEPLVKNTNSKNIVKRLEETRQNIEQLTKTPLQPILDITFEEGHVTAVLKEDGNHITNQITGLRKRLKQLELAEKVIPILEKTQKELRRLKKLQKPQQSPEKPIKPQSSATKGHQMKRIPSTGHPQSPKTSIKGNLRRRNRGKKPLK